MNAPWRLSPLSSGFWSIGDPVWLSFLCRGAWNEKGRDWFLNGQLLKISIQIHFCQRRVYLSLTFTLYSFDLIFLFFRWRHFVLSWQQSQNRSALNWYEEHAGWWQRTMHAMIWFMQDFKPITSLLIFNAPF